MVVFRSMSLVITPPSVSMPSDSGVTSSSRTSLTSPLRTPAWIAAPTATTSSGLTPRCGSLPLVSFLTSSWIAGIRVAPPTRMTSLRSPGVSSASLRAAWNGATVFSLRSAVSCSTVEAGDLAGVLGCLPLRVVEVRRDGDDGVRHLLAQVGFGVGLKLLQDHRRDLLGRVPLALDLDLDPAVLAGQSLVGHHLPLAINFVVVAAHEPLDRVHRVFGVDGGLAAGQLAHQALSRLGEGDDGRCGPATFGIWNDDRLAGLHDRDHRVGGAQVDAYCLCHCDFSFISAALAHGCRGQAGRYIPA